MPDRASVVSKLQIRDVKTIPVMMLDRIEKAAGWGIRWRLKILI